MRAVSVAFYGLALGLLAIGLRELLTGFEENRCSMTYMFEYPEYRRVSLPRRVTRLYPAYGLYLYGEGVYAQETRSLKLSGAPVLFLPGNAGSHKQARSLGSVALRKAENVEGGLHFNVFTVDFNEELVALYGGSLLRQTHFLHESIKAVLRLYKV
ncbi:GPI inositol-deacylase-like [Eucyclogobius newberryi]|uniref:GPI inositol-deacylase-like n=1 Tax=Eucyclogobius newberryi TaxID=166745 RepID=UPI003B5AE736